MHVVETQKVYLMLTFSSVWSTNKIKKVEKMLQLLSTHNRFVNVKLCLIFEASNIQKKDPSHAEIKVLPWAFQQKLKEL